MGLIQSIYMKPKQSEMDGIIERIYNTFTTEQGERTLMVVCGDHGMNDVYSFY
jgi:ethanolaminephosphotransferase